MGTITSISKRLGIGAVNILSSLAIISRPIVGSLGDVQAVSGVAGTVTGLLLFLNSLPIEFVVACFSLSLGYLIWSAIQDDLTRSRAITEAKAANERGMAEVKKANAHAWGFEPEFRDAMIAIAADRANMQSEMVEIRRIHEIYNATLATVGDNVAVRFEERAEKIVRDIFGKHFQSLRDERLFEEHKRLREQGHSMDMLKSQLDALSRRLDALPQSPEGIATETPQ